MSKLSHVFFASLILLGGAFAQAAGKYVVVVGMASEAKIARGSNAIVIVGAMREAQLRAKLAALNTADVKGVVSFGVAGGLADSLKVGRLTVPDVVVFEGKRWPASTALLATVRPAVEANGTIAHRGLLTGAAKLEAGTTEQRRAMRARTGADVVDMESHIAAQFAASRGLPFVAIRALSDTVGDVMPPAALEELDENGEIQLDRILGSIWRNPSQLALLMKTSKNFRIASKTLKDARASLGFLFGPK